METSILIPLLLLNFNMPLFGNPTAWYLFLGTVFSNLPWTCGDFMRWFVIVIYLFLRQLLLCDPYMRMFQESIWRINVRLHEMHCFVILCFHGECLAGGLLKFDLICVLWERCSCSTLGEYTAEGPMLSGSMFCSTGRPMLSGDIIFSWIVKTVLLILVEHFTNILFFVGFFPSRSYCIAWDWEIKAGMEIERFGVRIAVFALEIAFDGIWDCRSTWQWYMMELGIAVLPGQLPPILDVILDVPFYLAFGIFFRDLPYLATRRGVVFDTAVISTGLRGSGVHIRCFILCGEASLFLGDETRLWVFVTSRG